MPRKPTGDRPLTPAERQAHQRAKRIWQREVMIEALREVVASDYITEARETARRALASVTRD